MRFRTASPLLATVLAVAAVGLCVAGFVVVRSPEAPGSPEGRAPAPSTTPVAPASGSATATPAPSASSAPAERPYYDVEATTIDEQRAALFVNMARELDLADAVIEKLRKIFEGSKWLGQGNPKVTEHPMTRAECRTLRRSAELEDEQFPECGAVNMAPIYPHDRGRESADRCIDRYEFPNIACEYPVVWVKADEASMLCRALGKRLCDAHEWEGACAGDLLPVEKEYDFAKARLGMSYFHNQDRRVTWAYGPTKDHALCAAGSRKSKNCAASGYQCGSNTYPAGAFLRCKSAFGVYDLHGNAAEHMNLPLKPEELASRGGLGVTEMKGSWFIFQSYEAHIDDCRWRAPSWHESRVDDPESHRNYHLGFRCCKDIRRDPTPREH
jgi:formylglycine-generating enzyme required for sulfatase activity